MGFLSIQCSVFHKLQYCVPLPIHNPSIISNRSALHTAIEQWNIVARYHRNNVLINIESVSFSFIASTVFKMNLKGETYHYNVMH